MSDVIDMERLVEWVEILSGLLRKDMGVAPRKIHQHVEPREEFTPEVPPPSPPTSPKPALSKPASPPPPAPAPAAPPPPPPPVPVPPPPYPPFLPQSVLHQPSDGSLDNYAAISATATTTMPLTVWPPALLHFRVGSNNNNSKMLTNFIVSSSAHRGRPIAPAPDVGTQPRTLVPPSHSSRSNFLKGGRRQASATQGSSNSVPRKKLPPPILPLPVHRSCHENAIPYMAPFSSTERSANINADSSTISEAVTSSTSAAKKTGVQNSLSNAHKVGCKPSTIMASTDSGISADVTAWAGLGSGDKAGAVHASTNVSMSNDEWTDAKRLSTKRPHFRAEAEAAVKRKRYEESDTRSSSSSSSSIPSCSCDGKKLKKPGSPDDTELASPTSNSLLESSYRGLGRVHSFGDGDHIQLLDAEAVSLVYGINVSF